MPLEHAHPVQPRQDAFLQQPGQARGLAAIQQPGREAGRQFPSIGELGQYRLRQLVQHAIELLRLLITQLSRNDWEVASRDAFGLRRQVDLAVSWLIAGFAVRPVAEGSFVSGSCDCPYLLHCATGARAALMLVLVRAREHGWSAQRASDEAEALGFKLQNSEDFADFLRLVAG